MSAGRKSPVVLLKWKRPVDARQAVWDAIRQLTNGGYGFDAAGVIEICRIHRKTAGSYLSALVAGGYLTQEAGVFTLVRDVGLHAPRVRPDGSAVEQGNGRAAAWRGMRILKRFTIRELHIATGAAESDIKSFVRYLAKAGYLRVAAQGKGGRPSTYVMARNTGPKPPQVTRLKCVYDPNLNEVTWPTAQIEPEAKVEGQP